MSNQTNDVGLAAGSKVGKYEIVQRLAIGGQGIVYKARDPMLDRFVAIKQMSAHLAADATFLERFQREAQILAKLGSDQSAVVTVLDMIQDERGLFMVMEFVAGHTLEDSLHDNPGPVETKAVLAILWRLAAGLHTVHQAGIIHRDLKPSNIIIGAGLRCKIMDFGVAATSDAQTSMVLGTTKYMAPELYEHKTVDARADMYSLGFITYEMLLGRAKFNEQFADIVRDKHSEHLRWMKWHGSEMQVATPLHELCPELPRAISDIVAKMMAKRPEDRYANMEDLGKSIKTAFAPKPSSGGKHKSSRRRSKSSAAVAAGAGASAKGASGSGAFADEPSLDGGGPLTAPLPKKTLSLRAKLLIVGSVSACLVAGLVVLLVLGKRGNDNIEGRIRSAYAAAETLYKDQQYGQAAEQFAAVSKRRPRIREVAMASAMVYLAQTQDAMVRAEGTKDSDEQKKQWEIAANALEDADKAVQAEDAKQAWVMELRKTVTTLKDSQQIRRRFQEALTKADERLAAKKFSEAESALLDAPDTGIPAQQKLKAAMQIRIKETEFEDAYATRLGAARKARDDGDFAKALKASDDAVKLMSDERSGSVSEARLVAMKAEIAQLQKELKSDGAYKQSIALAAKLLADANALTGAPAREAKEKALEQLEAAATLQSGEALNRQIVQLKAEVAYDLGMEHLSAGESAKAIAALEQSLKIQRTDAAQRALDELNSNLKLSQRLAEADRAFDDGEYEAALKAYQSALASAGSDREKVKEIRGVMAECEFHLLLASAEALGEQRKYKEAAVELEKARQKLPERAGEADKLLDEMQRRQKYEALLKSASDLLGRRNYQQALDELKKAKDLGVGEEHEVQDLVNQVEYARALAKGKEAMEQGRYRDAWADFRQAQGYNDIEEIRKMIASAEEKMK